MPHIERRRLVRRAVSGGILFAAVSVVPLCLFEILYVALVRRPGFSSTWESVGFAAHLTLLLLSTAAVAGVIEGLLVLAVSQLTSLLARRRLSEPRWMAWIYSFLALPGIAVLAARIFSGRRAQLIPGKDFIAIGLGILGLVAAYVFFRLIIGVRDRFRIRRWGPAQAAALAPLMLLVALGFYVGDQRVLPGLYGFFHVALALFAVGFCQLAAGALHAAYRPRARWMSKLAEPGLAILVLLAAVAGAAFSLSRINRSEKLRFLYYEHTAVQSKALQLMSRLGLMRAGFATRRAGPAGEAEPQVPAASLMPGPRRNDANLVLISIDALRADHMGSYGYRRRTTPNLDAWAQGAARFERAYCQVPHTSFSVTSLLTGTYTYSLSTVDPGRRYATIADLLRRYGYKTGGFFPPAVFYIDRNNFTAYEKSLFGFEYVKFEYLEASQRVDQVLSFLEQHGSSKFFVWVHFFEPHEPYERHPGIDFGPRAADRYDGELAYVDAQIGRLLERIRRRHPNTYVALTADHGEEFGEHGSFYHGNALYDPQVRVPLIIGGPGIEPRAIKGAGQIIDLPVTLLSLVDVPVGADMRGNDLGPWLAGEDAARLPPVFAEMERKKMVVKGGRKLICDTARDFCELYDLESDPGERRNLLGERREEAGELRSVLMAWMASHVPRTRQRERNAEAEQAALFDRGRQKDPGAVPGLLKLARGPLETRREAIRLLVEMRAEAAAPAFRESLRDPDPAVRMQGTIGAALLGDRSRVPEVERLLERSDLPPSWRRDALLALARAGHAPAAVPLAELLETVEDIYERIEIMETLGKLGNPAAGPFLRQQLLTLRTRLYAIDALGKVRARVAVPDLVKALRSDRFTSWRKAAAQALGRIGEPASRPALQATVRNEIEAEVVAEALAALAGLEGLPVPGLASLGGGKRDWTCAAGRCRIELGRPCAALAGSDLLMVGEGLALPDGVAVYCGERKVAGGLLVGQTAAAMVTLPASHGLLELRATGRPPRLRYLAARPRPK